MIDAKNGTLMLDSTSLHELRLSIQTAAPSATMNREQSYEGAYSIGAEAVRFPQVYAPTRTEKLMSQSSDGKPVNERSLNLVCDVSQADRIISPISSTSSQSASDQSQAMVSPYISPTDDTDDNKPNQPGRDSQHWNGSIQCSPDHNDAAQSENFSHKNSATIYVGDDVRNSNYQQNPVAPNVSRLLHSARPAEQCCSNRNRSAMVYSQCEPEIPSEEPPHMLFASGDAPIIEASQERSVDLLERWALSTQQYIERLDQLVCMLETRWQEYLRKCPDLYVLSGGTRFGSPFEAGLQGLRRCFNGQRPSKIQDILPLTYLVYACAYMCHYCDPSYSLDDLYKNVRQWGNFISDEQDQERFLRIADLFWSTLHTVSDLQSELQSTDLDQTEHPSQAKSLRLYIPETSFTASQHSCPEPMVRETLDTDLYTHLRGGLVAETCARVLDDFAYSVILEERLHTVADSLRNRRSAAFIRSEVTSVIVPLLEKSKYSPFHRIIEDTWNVFALGYLHNIREVEVFLLAGFRHNYHSGRDYRIYREHVTFLCDQAVQSHESSWRNGYYATHIDHMQAIWLGLEKRRRRASEHSPLSDRYGQVHPFPNHAQNLCATPTSSISECSASTPSTLMSNSSSLTLASTNTSSDDTFWASSSDPSPASSIPSSLSSPGQLQHYTGATAQAVTRCLICSQPFRGNFENRKSNLRRHLRHIHHQGEQSACNVTGCDKIFGRADSLRIHRQKAHNINEPIVKSGSRRRRRSSKELVRLQANHF